MCMFVQINSILLDLFMCLNQLTGYDCCTNGRDHRCNDSTSISKWGNCLVPGQLQKQSPAPGTDTGLVWDATSFMLCITSVDLCTHMHGLVTLTCYNVISLKNEILWPWPGHRGIWIKKKKKYFPVLNVRHSNSCSVWQFEKYGGIVLKYPGKRPPKKSQEKFPVWT